MAYTYRRASKAMFVTSSTTAAAFLATGFSEIVPISAFGYFASILVVANYLLVITMFPTWIILVERYCSDKCSYTKLCATCCCLCCFKRVFRIQAVNRISSSRSRPSSIQTQASRQSLSFRIELNCLERFCFNKFYAFISNASIFLVIGLLAWVGIAGYFALQLKPVSEQEIWISNDNRIQKAFHLLHNQYPKTGEDTVVKVSLFWGVDGLDRSKVSRWDDSNYGDLVWDPGFSASSTQAQEFILNLCEELKKDEGNVNGADSKNGGGAVTCFMEGFKDWLTANGKDFPVTSLSDFQEEMIAFNADPASLFYRNEGVLGFKDGRLKYIQIDALTNIKLGAASKIRKPVIEYWENKISQLNLKASQTLGVQSLSSGKMTGGNGFAYITAEQGLVSSAIQGVIISWIFSFIMITLSTRNLIISLYSILSIFCVTISVLGVISLAGWEFGVAQSIGIVVLIGLAIDYIVHLTNHYMESQEQCRKDRIRQAFRDMSLSILGGAITSFGTVFPVLFGNLIVLVKFSIITISIILFSLIFALFFFGSLAYLGGPSGKCGNLKELVSCILCRRKAKKKKRIFLRKVSVTLSPKKRTESSDPLKEIPEKED